MSAEAARHLRPVEPHERDDPKHPADWRARIAACRAALAGAEARPEWRRLRPVVAVRPEDAERRHPPERPFGPRTIDS